MEFCGIPVAPTSVDARFLFNAINEGRLDVASWTLRFQIKQHLRFCQSNVFGFL
jgi:hypothetical protein